MVSPDSQPASFSFTENGRTVSVTAPETTPLLDVPRNHLDLKGARFGCGAEQCGYCLAGILISAKALLDRDPSPSRREVAEALDGNICRRGSHNRIIRAILKASGQPRPEAPA